MRRNLKTVSAFAEDSPLTEPQIRWQIFNAASNGMDDHGVIVRIGRRVYIDVERFDEWLEAQQVARRAEGA